MLRMCVPVCLARAVCELRCAQLVQRHDNADGIALGLLPSRRCRHLQQQQGQQARRCGLHAGTQQARRCGLHAVPIRGP